MLLKLSDSLGDRGPAGAANNEKQRGDR
jgi:hypothetical protein